MLAIVELPTDDRMRDLGGPPKRQEEVEAANPVEVVSSGLPMLIVIGFRSIVAAKNSI